jgi:flagellar motor switch protein FliM
MESIKETILHLTGEKPEFTLEAMHYESFAKYLAKISSKTSLAVFGMNPISGKAVLEVDPALSILAIERLLGGKPKSMPEKRELSDTEQGVFEYLLLQVLAGIYSACNENPKLHFRFDRFVNDQRGLAELAAAEEKVAILVFRVQLGKHSGFVRIVFPNPFMEEAFLDSSIAAGPDDAGYEYYERLLERFDFIKVPVRAEVGKVALTPEELGSIESGDTVLFDESYIEYSDGRVDGRALLRIGAGFSGGLEADLELLGRKASCTLKGLYKGE